MDALREKLAERCAKLEAVNAQLLNSALVYKHAFDHICMHIQTEGEGSIAYMPLNEWVNHGAIDAAAKEWLAFSAAYTLLKAKEQ